MNEIRIEPSCITFPNTYISAVSQYTLTIYNDGNETLNLLWRRYSSKEEEKIALDKIDQTDSTERQEKVEELQYISEIFRVDLSPIEIWPHSSKQILVKYQPELAQPYCETAYLYSEKFEERIPVQFNGLGLPPDAIFNVSAVNIGHVVLDSILDYKIVLQNVGQVDVDFNYSSDVPKTFTFSPSSGHIPIGGSMEIIATFTANFVGSFNEEFEFKIKGAIKNFPRVNFYGRVVGPSYTINTKAIAFGDVSFGFIHTKTFEIENKSDIPFDYTFVLEYNGEFSGREFAITPISETIGKYGKQTVKIEFIPTKIQKYNLKMHMNIARFGQGLVSIPISANCICPEISLSQPVVDLGNVFIGYQYTGSVTLVDNTEFPAKFEYVDINDASKLQADIEIVKHNGQIDQRSKTDFVFKFTPRQLGPLNIIQYINILGSVEKPLTFCIKAVGIGPAISLNQQQINWGSIPVLKKSTQKLILSNNGKIVANFKAMIECDQNVFTLATPKGIILPNESFTSEINAYLDDNTEFKGKLIFEFENLSPITVPLRAKGVGTAVSADIPMDTIDFGYIYANQQITKTITFTNKGRKPQEIRFTLTKPRLDTDDKNCFSFKVIPDSEVIEKNESAEFTIVMNCTRPINFSMNMQVNSSQGRQREELFSPLVKGMFVKPIVNFSSQMLEFKHLHDIQKEKEYLENTNQKTPSPALLTDEEKTLVITNNSKLPLTLNLDCPEPFSCSLNHFTLQPKESKDCVVTFSTAFKTDFACETISKKLSITLDNLPQKFNVNLKGIIVFPNIEFNPSGTVLFGSMLKNTEQTKDIILKNPTELPATFEWELMPASNDQSVDMSKIFDIYPIRSTIPAGGTDTMHFSFFAMNDQGANINYEARAICKVEGGPEYSIPLYGGSADITYTIEPLQMNFGKKSYLTPITSSINFSNTCEVPLKFAVRVPKACKFNQISFTPCEGTLDPHQTIQLGINIITGMPISYNEQFFIQIGHFEEVRIDCDVQCFIPQLKFTLPRSCDDPTMATVNTKKISKKPSGQIPPIQDLAVVENELVYQQLQSTPLVGSVRRKRKEELKKDYDGFIVSKYDMDLGKIVFGQKREFHLKAKTISPFPITFSLNTASLSGTGFTIETTSFNNVPPDTDIDIPVVFNIQKRTNNCLGEVEFPIPFVMSTDFALIVYVKANLVMPTINLSQQHFDFGNVVVGQTLILSLQLQNMNEVPCEYKFGEAEYTNVLQRNMSQGSISPYTANPSSGILPPSSFINVEIAFAPKQEKNFSMQFPIEIKHNTKPLYVTLKGNGIQLKIIFDPPSIKMPPMIPFSEPATTTVKLKNPTQYPIEVMANQFDLQLLIDQLEAKQMQEEKEKNKKLDDNIKMTPSQENFNPLNNEEIMFTNQTISRFSICVIVNGISGSGRTTVSKAIASYLDVPVLSLKELWADLIASDNKNATDYINLIKDKISQQEFYDGFVVDGLDGLPEASETDSFLQHCLKQKNAWEEVFNNPLQVYNHNNLTASEQALSYLLGALEGHYVFQVALKATNEQMNERKERQAIEDAKRQEEEAIKEKEMLFQITEEDYAKLSPEEQAEVDKKRSEHRRRLLRGILATIKDQEGEGGEGKKKSKHKHRSKKEDGEKSDAKDSSRSKSSKHHRSKKEKEEKEEPPPPPPVAEEKPKETKRKKGLQLDPLDYSIANFMFTLGAISAKIRDTPNITVIDPLAVIGMESKDILPKVVEEIPPQQTTSQETLTKDKTQSKELLKQEEEEKKEEQEEEEKKEEEIIFAPHITQVNTIVIDINNDNPENINEEARRFIPQPNGLKNRIFASQIPEQRLIMPDQQNYKRATLFQMPEHVFIQLEQTDNEKMIQWLDSRPSTVASNTGGRKSRANKNKREPSVIDDLDTSKNTPRWIIGPNAEKELTLIFEPMFVGTYNDNIIFSLTNGMADNFKLHVSGECYNPEFDRNPKTMFSKVMQRLDKGADCAFLLETSEYNFGPLLVSKGDKGNSKANPNAPSPYRGIANIVNTSQFPIEFTAFVTDLVGHNGFSLENNNFIVEKGQTYQFQFKFNAANAEVFKSQIKLFAQDNPEPFAFNVSAEGCLPCIEPSTTNLDFEKLLLNQTRTLKVELKNTGLIPAAWSFKNIQQLDKNFTLNATEGIINPKSTFVLTAMFTSTKAVVIKKSLILEVSNKEKTKAFSSYNINFQAEAFEINVDFQFPKGMDCLDFGALKVSQPKTLSCQLTNKGKYQGNFKVQFTNPKIQPHFQITPMEGPIPPGKTPANISFTFMCSKVQKFANMKGIQILLSDATTGSKTDTLPISFNAATMYSQFKIEPQKKIDFGPVTVLNTETKQITLTNHGVFPFDFDITPKAKKPPENETEKSSSKMGKNAKAAKAPPPKNKGKKPNEKALSFGQFSVSPSNGSVAPGASVTIEVEFSPQIPGNFTSVAVFNITDAPQNAGKVNFTLTGSSHIPGIECSHFEKILPGLALALSFDRPKITSTTFIEDEQSLVFNPIVVGMKSKVTAKIINIQPIPCTVDLGVKPKAKVSGQFPFDISEKCINLNGNSEASFDITFSPNGVDKFLGLFEAVVKNGTDPATKALKFSVEGVGSLPQISPVGLEKTGKNSSLYTLNMGKTLVGFSRQKSIVVKNDGVITTKLQISAKPSPDFELVGIDAGTTYSIDPNRIIDLPILFSPSKTRKCQFEVTVNLVDNPKGSLNFVVNAEGFSEDIVLEGVRGEDELVMPDTVVGRQNSIVFTMKNVSPADIRFQWQSHPDFTFAPSVGHLRLGKSKDIIISYFSDKPVKHVGTKINCTWNRITMTNANSPDWDDTMKVVKYITKAQLEAMNPPQEEEPPKDAKLKNSKRQSNSRGSVRNSHVDIKAATAPKEPPKESKLVDDGDTFVRVVEVKPEPEHTIQTNIKTNSMAVRVFAISDSIKYTIDTTEVNFSPTMMFETRSSEVKITNPTTIRFDYSWRIAEFKSLRSEYVSSHGYPLKVTPHTGFIEPGGSTVFSITFAPMEVDDFTANLVCDIPFIQTPPPSVRVTGLSRRPLCHFNVQLSDYLTRRHPDYTYKLPNDVKVIEIFAKKVGAKAMYRFEVINPTSSPYEVTFSRVDNGEPLSSKVNCETPNALLSSGKRFSAAFSFVPDSHKTIESLWEFKIGGHDGVVTILVVGRIMPQ